MRKRQLIEWLICQLIDTDVMQTTLTATCGRKLLACKAVKPTPTPADNNVDSKWRI